MILLLNRRISYAESFIASGRDIYFELFIENGGSGTLEK